VNVLEDTVNEKLKIKLKEMLKELMPSVFCTLRRVLNKVVFFISCVIIEGVSNAIY